MRQKTFAAGWGICLALLTLMHGTAIASADDVPLRPLTAQVNPDAGHLLVSLRSHFDHLSKNNALRKAPDGTLRSRAGYETVPMYGFAALLEIDDTHAFDDSDYSTNNGQAGYSAIGDPETIEINSAYISYSGMFDTAFTYGRQRLNLDNERFVGSDDWHQNQQTYDAVTVQNTSLTGTAITLAYVDKIRTVFGVDSDADAIDLQAPLINVEYEGSPLLKVSGYGYFLNFENDPAASRQTSGLRLTGEYLMSQLALLYAVEYARQSDYKDGMSEIDADYKHLKAGMKLRGVTTEVGYEVLSGNGDYAFQTPLASAHAFNGWADQFLVTPLQGLQDVYISADTSFAGVRWKAVYHQFNSEQGAVDYGNELNLLVVKKFAQRYTVGLKYAQYFADEFSVDTEKIQVYAEINI